MTEHTQHPLDYLLVLKRRKMWFVVPFALCVATGLALVVLLPTTYRSSARVAVAAPAVTRDLVSVSGGLDREERLRALGQQLRSPTVLERVAREEGLTADRPLPDVAQELLERISVELPAPIGREPELNAFDIVYRDRTAERAQRITNRLAQVFADEYSRSREMQAEGTAEFLGTQLRASQDRIGNLETRLRAAKETHMGKLPEQTLANLQTLSGMRQQLETTSNNIRSEQDRLSLLNHQVQMVKQGQYAAAAAPGSPSATSPQQRVVAIERELADARTKYNDNHPEIRILQDELASAKAEVAAIAKQPESARQQQLAADPMYQQLVSDQNLTQLRIRALQRTEAQLQRDIVQYQQRVEATPMVEQELASVQREYDFERENVKQLSEKHAAALVQEQIARSRDGERFSVLNAAYLPEAPESPNRLRLMLIAVALGLALGGGLAFGREYLDQSVRDAGAFQAEFDVPVLAEIPHIRDAA
jgi:protein tyrosine kinase modulator